MNKKILAVSLIMSLLLIGYLGYLVFWKFGLNLWALTKEPVEKNDIIISQTSEYGNFRETYLLNDGSFLDVNKLARALQEEECYEGTIAQEQYNSLTAFVEASGFFDTQITQRHERGLLCEETYTVIVKIGNRENVLSLPCAGEFTESTKKTADVMESISSKLNEMINSSKRICKQGGYIKIDKILLNCAAKAKAYKERTGRDVNYNAYDLSNIDSYLEKGVKNWGTFIFVGPVDEAVNSYQGKRFTFGRICYSVTLYEFDGTEFKALY